MQWPCNLALCSTRMLVKNSKSIRPLGRTPKELLDTVGDLKARDVNLISLEERIATTSASGELVIAARNSFSPSRPRQRWNIRLSGRQATWYRRINSLQGYQKRGSVIHVPPSFLLSVNLHTNLPIRPDMSGNIVATFAEFEIDLIKLRTERKWPLQRRKRRCGARIQN